MRTLEEQVEETGLENPTVRRALVRVLVDRGLPDAALVQVRKALESAPDDPELWDLLVEIHREAGRTAEAAAARVGACRARPVEFACWSEAAALYESAGDAAASERALTTIVESAPDEADAHEALALALQDQGRWLDALGRWRVVVRLRQTSPAGYLGMALAALEAQLRDEADSALDHILSRVWPKVFEDVVRQALEIREGLERNGTAP
jgi:tetratricopeptide (TPR) repeat protein